MMFIVHLQWQRAYKVAPPPLFPQRLDLPRYVVELFPSLVLRVLFITHLHSTRQQEPTPARTHSLLQFLPYHLHLLQMLSQLRQYYTHIALG